MMKFLWIGNLDINSEITHQDLIDGYSISLAHLLKRAFICVIVQVYSGHSHVI